MTTFQARHSHPFTLAEIEQLEPDALLSEIKRLQNSLQHLGKTQDQLREFLADEPDGDADGEVGKAIAENEVTIASQAERVEMLKLVLRGKIGEGAMRHLGLDERKEVSQAATGARGGDTGELDPDEGIHL